MTKILTGAILVVSFFSVLLATGTTRASHVTKGISLAEVIALSEWIGSAEYLGPDEKISAGYRFRAIETLTNKMGDKQPSGEFVVVTPLAVANAMVRQVYNTTGVRRFPLIRRLTEGAGLPGEKGEKRILFLREHDDRVLVLTAADASVAWNQRDRVVKMISGQAEMNADLVFSGRVESIDIAPLKGSRNNFVVKTRVLKVIRGSFEGSHFSFRIHSPTKSRIVVGKELEVRARAIPEGYFVDPIQFLGR